MDRRSAIVSSFAITAGIFLVPSCLQEKRKPSLELQNLAIDSAKEDLLAELSEAIIPKTSTPGAKDLQSHLFALLMVDDCFSPAEQKQFLSGLDLFESNAKTRFGNSFVNCAAAQKTDLLQSMEKKTGIPEDVLFFYNTMKKLTIQSFTTSKFFLTKIHIYEMVPSRWKGCIPLTKSNT